MGHDNSVAAVKFSPDGRLIATATLFCPSVRIYDSQNGRLSVEFPVQVNSLNQSLGWVPSNNKQLFVLSQYDDNIHCLDLSTRTFRWSIYGGRDAKCIALASNGTFIAASTSSSVSLWETSTHKKIECAIQHTSFIGSMALSSNHDLVTAGRKDITIRNLCEVLPSRHCDDVSESASCAHCVKWLPNHE